MMPTRSAPLASQSFATWDATLVTLYSRMKKLRIRHASSAQPCRG
jgi:hypothetical protein